MTFFNLTFHVYKRLLTPFP